MASFAMGAGSMLPTPPPSMPPSPAKLDDVDRDLVQELRQQPIKRKWASVEDLQQFFAIPMAAVHRFPQQHIDRRQIIQGHHSSISQQYVDHFTSSYPAQRRCLPLPHKALNIANAKPLEKRLAMPRSSGAHQANQYPAAVIVQRVKLDPERRIVDPFPPLQRLSADRYFKNTTFVPHDDGSEGRTSKKRKLCQEGPNTPPASPQIHTLDPQRSSTPRKYTPEERDDRTFRELETKYATRVDRWFRTVLDRVASHSPTSYGRFSRELLKMPTHVSRDWLEATKDNDVGREQCIIRLHELIYGLLTRIRDEHQDDAIYNSSDCDNSGTDVDADPTLRFRAPLTGTGAWKEMTTFWQMLNGQQGTEIRKYWLPVVQMQYGLDKGHMTNQDLFSV